MSVHLERRVVDRHIELAELAHRLFHRALAELGVLDVAFNGEAFAAFALDPAMPNSFGRVC